MKTEPVSYHKDVSNLFETFSQLPQSVLFDSGNPGPHAGHIDIFSALPIHTLSINADQIILTENNQSHQLPNIEQVIERLNRDWQRMDNDYSFSGGWMGHASYELVHLLESNSLGSPRHSNIPLFWAGYYNWAIINNHKTQSAYLIYEPSIDEETLLTIKRLLNSHDHQTEKNTFQLTSPFNPEVTTRNYQANFSRVQTHISLGDCYQVNYTMPFTGTYTGSTFDAYCRLRHAVPSPFMVYLNNDNYVIQSISPERFIKAFHQKVTTQPIKGTAPRNTSHAQTDLLLAKQLQRSPKDRAENVMIVDLLRHDFGKFCLPHSIKVDKLFAIESYENVHHLVSTVSGEIQPEKTVWHLFFGAFPGGSITGAPKISACKIINSIEPDSRNIYCGSLFYASNNGRFDSNIAIRTLLCQDQKITASAGGGVVADSTSEGEYNECLLKISKLLSSLL